MAALREDVVQISFDIDSAGVNELRRMLDQLQRGLRDTDENAESAQRELNGIARTNLDKVTNGAKKLGSALGTVATKAALAVTKLTAVSAAGVGALATKSVMSYADYEQLVGGVETLFKDASGTVQKYADEAYKTAGLSQNEYMETVTGFSASLIQSLGGDTAAAASYADMAIRDMSDNANKMGSNMADIQNAYQGFAKQNYTMLDNLKLGYGGTKEEMQRLLKDAEKLTGKKFDLSSYADVVEAVHAIQESMGITGTTAAEADKTISGSFNSMKAAWGNMLNALILGGDDFDRSIDNLIGTVKTFLRNLIPAVTKSLEGMGEMIEALAPMLEKELPGMIETMLPPLIKAATALVKGLIVALPSVIKTIVAELPTILSELWSAVKEAFGNPPALDKVEETFAKIGEWFKSNTETIKNLIPVVLGLVGAFKAFKAFKGLSGLIGGGGAAGGGGIFSSLANMKVTTVLKAILNVTLILAALAGLAAAFMWLSPKIAALGDLQSFLKVMLVIGIVGVMGMAMAKLAGMVGRIKVSTVAKGVANIAIVLTGFGVLAAALMAVAPDLAVLSDIKSIAKVLFVIAVTGIVGSALAGLAGLVGMIPVSATLTGLENVALVLGGFTAIVVAFGALKEIPGFDDFLANGGKVLTDICGILGEMVGSIIGGIGEGVTNALPGIGTNLSNFATNIQPMLDVFGKQDTSGISNFATALATLIGVLVGDSITSFFTGGIDYAQLASDLTTFSTNLGGFFDNVSKIGDDGFKKATALFDCLAGITGLPNDGGIVGWFEGDVNFTKITDGMVAFAGAYDSFITLGKIPDNAFTNITNLFNALAGVKDLPDSGGVLQFMTGEVNFTKIADGIKSFGSDDMIAAITSIQNIPADGFTQITKLFDCLAGVKELPASGGILQFMTGEVDFLKITAGIMAFGSDGMLTAINKIKDLDEDAFTNLTKLFTSLGEVKALPASGGIVQMFTGDIDFTKFATGVQSFGSETTISALTALGNLNASSFDNLTKLFTALGEVKALPASGGIVQMFTGEIDFTKFSDGVQSFGSETTVAALTALGNVSADSFSNLTELFSALGGVKALPASGGIVQLITGEVDFDKLATGLQAFGSETTVAALMNLEKVSADSFSKLTGLFSALGGVEALPASGGIVQLITGEVDFEKLAGGLTAFGSESAIAALDRIKKIDQSSLDNLTALFNALGGISDLPTEGGLVNWFTGTVDFEKLAGGLKAFGSEETRAALNRIADLPEGGLANMTALFNAFAGVKDLPAEGGLINWFTGTIDFTKLAEGLKTFGGTYTLEALTAIGSVPSGSFTNLSELFNAFAKVNDLPEGGGIFAWFTGDKTSTLTQIAEKLPTLATNIADFHTNLGGIESFTKISDLFETLDGIEINSNVAQGQGFLGLGASKMAEIGQGLTDFANKAATFFRAINDLNLEKFKGFFEELGTVGDLPTSIKGLNGYVGTELDNLKATIDAKLLLISATIVKFSSDVNTHFTIFTTTMTESGASIMTGVNSGMESMRAALVATAASIAADIQKAFDVELDINSPSKVMIGKGEDWGTGGIIGIRNKIPDVKRAAQDYAMASVSFGSYTPENSASSYYSSTSSETMNVAPVFNLHITGTADDRATARKVKRYVADAVRETLDSFERRTPVVREA